MEPSEKLVTRRLHSHIRDIMERRVRDNKGVWVFSPISLNKRSVCYTADHCCDSLLNMESQLN